jgi:protoheme IX farnesyltransferase
MFIITVLPIVPRLSGPLYLVGAVILGLIFLYWSLAMIFHWREDAPIQTFKYSIFYLMALFVVMLVDHYIYPTATL